MKPQSRAPARLTPAGACPDNAGMNFVRRTSPLSTAVRLHALRVWRMARRFGARPPELR